jgi:hypothetical protein
MFSEAQKPDTPPGANGDLPASTALPNQPGFVVGLCSIAAGLVGFGMPVVGMLVSCIGIGLGIWAFRKGRAAHYRRSIVCGIAGIVLSVLSFVFWPYVMVASSYH